MSSKIISEKEAALYTETVFMKATGKTAQWRFCKFIVFHNPSKCKYIKAPRQHRNVITNQKKWFVCFTDKEKDRFGNGLRIINLSNLTIRCQKVEKGLPHTNLKLLVNLTFWKTDYLIAQLRAGFQQNVFRLKTCPRGELEAQ